LKNKTQEKEGKREKWRRSGELGKITERGEWAVVGGDVNSKLEGKSKTESELRKENPQKSTTKEKCNAKWRKGGDTYTECSLSLC